MAYGKQQKSFKAMKRSGTKKGVFDKSGSQCLAPTATMRSKGKSTKKPLMLHDMD